MDCKEISMLLRLAVDVEGLARLRVYPFAIDV